ncbi:unnamed protein product [Victoria cruziana]
MENDSKKRKNKKKKNKQAKSTEDITRIGRTAHLQQNLLATSEQSIQLQSSNGGEVDNSGHSESDARPDQHELVKKLQEHTLILEGQLACLESEKSSWLEEKAVIEGELARLESEKKYWLEKEASLGGCLRILEDEKKSWTLEEVKELNESKDLLLQERQELISRINDLELRIQQLTFDAESQTLPQDDHSGGTNALVEKLMTQNAELMGKVNELHIQIDQLRSASMAVKVAEFPTGQGISTQPPDEAGLLKPSPRMEVPTLSSFNASVSKTPTFNGSASIHDDNATVQSAPFPVAMPIPMYPPQYSEKADSPLPMNRHLPNHVDLGSEKHAIPSEDTVSQVQLDEIPVTYDNIEIVEEAEPEKKASEDGKRSTELVVEGREVPFSDAPLTGAPFRLLGFVARYVSGADLVKPKKSPG